MAPEQVEGKDTDERSDIFSFGAVFYEMITGQRPFSGDTQAAVLAAILKDPPPPMSQQPSQRQPPQSQSMLPRALERVVRKCLEKKPDDRWQSARDLKPTLELIDLDAPPPTTSSASVPIPAQRPPWKRWLWGSIAMVALATIAAAAWAYWLKPAAPARATRFQVTLPENVNFSEYVSVSPDGHKLVFNATGAQSGLWIHDLDTLEWRKLPGTEGAMSPFWSPDSRFLGYGVGNDLKKIEVAGGPAQTLCTIPQPVGTGTWSADNVILFGVYRVSGPIRRVSSSGGVPTAITEPDQRMKAHWLPAFLPDGKHFLYLGGDTPEVYGIYAGSLDAKPAEQSKERILATTFAASYVDGNLFFMRDGTLMVQPFDAAKLQLRGEPVPVAEHVGTTGATGIFSVSKSGVLAYRSGANNAAGTLQATWFDRQGKVTGTFGEPGPDQGLALSPDATRAAGRDAPAGGNGDIWLQDFARGVRTRLTFRQSPGSFPVWSPDGARIIFSAGSSSIDTIYEKAASGAGEEKELLKTPDGVMFPSSWSRDGRFLLYYVANAPNTGADIWVLPLGGDRKPDLLLGTKFNEAYGSFSPDGRWIAYVSAESGRTEVYVRPFVPSGPSLGEGKWQVSKDGAVVSLPRWRGDGKEILFMGVGNTMTAVDVNGSGPAFQMDTPKQLFVAPAGNGWDVTADGTRFLLAVEPGRSQNQTTQTPITVVLNWQADLKR